MNFLRLAAAGKRGSSRIGSLAVLCAVLAGPASPASAADTPSGTVSRGVADVRVPAGFVVEQVAGPPLVKHPMMACFDDRGRLFIAESGGVNQTAPELIASRPHKIVLLEDTDGDGRFDKATTFAENLTEPNGVLWHDGALYVCSAPYLWRFEDTDGDGRADRRQRILGRFSFIGMSDSLHGPELGPDGRLYLCGGQHGWALEEQTSDRGRNQPDPASDTDKSILQALAGPWTSSAPGVFSCWPDGSDAQPLAFGGLCNPVEVTFTPEGEVLGTVSVYDMVEGRHDALLHWIDGGVFNLREQHYPRMKMTGDILTPLSRRGHVAPAGLTRYRSQAFGSDYRNNVFLCEFNTHKVYRLPIERQGATFRSRDELFLSSENTDRHFTDVCEDADGSLLVIDTGGWFLRGCPTSQIAKPEILGGIYRVRKVAAAGPADPWGSKIGWKTAAPDELAARLGDERFAVADRAIAELASRGDSAVEAVGRVLATNKIAAARRDAVWTLCRLRTDRARAALRPALDDPDTSVRLAATHAVSVLRDAAAQDRLRRMVDAGEAPIRREAAAALGRIGKAEAVPTLLASLGHDNDRFLEHALTYALIEIDDREATLPGLKSPLPIVRRDALIALDRMERGNLTPRDVSALLTSDDAHLQRVLLDIASRRGWVDETSGIVRRWLAGGELSPERRAAIRSALFAFRGQAKIQQLIGEMLVAQGVADDTRLLLLEAVERSELKELPDAWTAPLLAALQSSNRRIVQQAIASIAASGQRHFDDGLISLARDTRALPATRVAALAVAAQNGKLLSPDLFALLVAQCRPDVEAVTRLTASRTIGIARLDERQLEQVADAIHRAGPLELTSLVRSFKQTNSRAAGLLLVKALGESPGATSLQPAELNQILEKYASEVRAAARPLLDRLNVDARAQAARLAELQSLLSGGDVSRGRDVFFGKQASCSACHRVADRGEQIGPNLSRIGEIRTPRDLLEAIVFPSASFARGFEPYSIITNAGKAYNGIISRETSEAFYLRTAERIEVRVAKDEIEEMLPGKVSIMPQGLDKILSADQLRDLLAYLTSLKADDARPATASKP